MYDAMVSRKTFLLVHLQVIQELRAQLSSKFESNVSVDTPGITVGIHLPTGRKIYWKFEAQSPTLVHTMLIKQNLSLNIYITNLF